MERYALKWLGMVLFFAFMVSFVNGINEAWAGKKEAAFQKQITGNWELVTLINEQDGKKSEPFGSNPLGSLIFSSDGKFSLIIMKADLPKFAVNNRTKGTTEENQAVVQGSIAAFGSYKVADVKEGKVILHFTGCTFPNWIGQDQERILTVTGNEMKMITPAAAVGGTNTLTLKRTK